MFVVLFDTHAFVKRLTAAGMPEAQAEVLADQQAQLIDERLATKADISVLATVKGLDDLRSDTKNGLDDLRRDTRKGLDDLRSDSKVMLAETKADILKWVIGTIGFQTLVILGAVLALSRSGH